jgi:hypothetical protein
MPGFYLPAGFRVSRYELVRLIGVGGSGAVYEAVDSSLGRRVAIKLRDVPEGAVLARRARARFVTEARAAAQLCHPNVVSVFDFGIERDIAFLVMELVEGETLAHLMKRDRPLGLPRTLEVLMPILSAVADLHAHGIIHRDLKPANILLGWAGVTAPKLADFGVSRFVDESASLTETGTTLGTPGYMAPEAMRSSRDADERSDQYSLGVLLYECITGAKPFRGETTYEVMHAVLRDAVLPPSQVDLCLPGRLDPIVLRAMHRDAKHRFDSIDALAEALLSIAPDGVRLAWERQVEPAASTKAVFVANRGDDAFPDVWVNDGVALSMRGDVLIVLWRSPATMARVQWSFDVADRLVTQRPEGVVVLVILLPSSSPPDYPATLECMTRLRRLRPAVRRQSTVALGGAIWQRVVRGVHHAMSLPMRARTGRLTMSGTVEAGIRLLQEGAGPSTPSSSAIRDDVLALFEALQLPTPQIGPLPIDSQRTPGKTLAP